MAKIKKDTSLRKAILQAAITGQLISNVDGETETGKQLLDRIIEERNKKLLAEWEEKLKENPKTKKRKKCGNTRTLLLLARNSRYCRLCWRQSKFGRSGKEFRC